jgi:hypothetical protein
MEHLIDVWGDVLAWGAVLALVAAGAGLATRLGERRRTRPILAHAVAVADAELAAAEGPHRLDPAQEWSLVVLHATLHLERFAALAALQADAARKIAAAEHAYNRLVDDCANLCPPASAPAVLPPPQRVAVPRKFLRALAHPVEREPLAA